MNLKASFAASLLALLFGAACSSASTPPKPAGVAFASCADAKASGYHDMARGTAGYSAKLDADGDGIACVS